MLVEENVKICFIDFVAISWLFMCVWNCGHILCWTSFTLVIFSFCTMDNMLFSVWCNIWWTLSTIVYTKGQGKNKIALFIG